MIDPRIWLPLLGQNTFVCTAANFWRRAVREVIIGGCRLIHADCRTVVPSLEKADLLLTDPPFGINMARGFGGGGYDGFGGGRKRKPKTYDGTWDGERPDSATFNMMLLAADRHIIWGGNYFSDMLPASQKWLWWDKCQTMPSYSDGELAWTSLSGTATKKFVYNGSGLAAKEKDREHPTQKPVELMKWCIGLTDADLILDCFMGVGSAGVAAAKLGRKFIGIEIDEGYFDIASERIRKAYAQPDMFVSAPKAPQPVQQPLFGEAAE
jgi:hypothetical protein